MPQSREERTYHVVAAVGDPAQLLPLLTVGCALAEAHNGQVTLLSVTPDGQKPAWLTVPETCDAVPVNIVPRLGHHAGGAILAAVSEDPPDLLLMGWSGSRGRDRYLLGSTLDPLIKKAPCDIAVLRISEDPDHLANTLCEARQILVPMRGDIKRGGANAALAADLALNLSPDVQVTALNVAQLSRGRAGIQLGREQLADALKLWEGNERVRPKVVQAPGVVGGILREAKSGYDLLLIGASRESYIDRMLFGNIPQTIASESPVPTIVVKRRERWEENLLRRTRERLLEALPSLTIAERAEVYRSIRRGARPDADFFLMIGLSAMISALGLLLNSPAVIIGAMLVAPLMSAIVGLGLGVVQGDLRLLRLAVGATLRGMLLAVAVGALVGLVGSLVGLIEPGTSPGAEILGRTNPSLLDLGVALASGAAGAYALCRKNVSASLPGVAIAAALVPPLAVVGIGLALGDGRITGGALLLFFTNLIAISAAGGLVFLWLGFRPELTIQSRARVFAGGVLSVTVLLLAVTVPLGLLTADTLQEADFERTLESVLRRETAAMGNVELEDWRIVEDSGEALSLEVSVRTSRQPSHRDVVDLQTRVAVSLQRTVALRLTVIPITQLDPFVPPTFTPTPLPTATATPGPTSTATASPTHTHTPTPTPTPLPSSTATNTPSSTPTNTPTATATATHTPSPTPTPTHTLTPTPAVAAIGGTGGLGVRLRWTPGGATAGVLREGEQIEVLYERQLLEDQEWVQIRDQQGRVGWVASQFVQLQP